MVVACLANRNYRAAAAVSQQLPEFFDDREHCMIPVGALLTRTVFKTAGWYQRRYRVHQSSPQTPSICGF
jgi:hypothetical protein